MNTVDTPATRSVVNTAEQVEPRVQVRNLSKKFLRKNGQEVKAIDGISLDVQPGEFLVLLGPSGCGKTTLLRAIAGLENSDSGEIVLDNRTLVSSERSIAVPPEKRRISMLFQSYALWPHMTVFENIAYPLKNMKVAKGEIAARVGGMLERVHCEEIAEQYPGEISGGQQQRVALARCLVSGSNLVLFDEPLSNVDAKVRQVLRRQLKMLQREIGFSAVYVTHDQDEAMRLGDRIAVLDEGQIAQLGTPAEIYLRPASRYVANFVGGLNEFAATNVRRDADGSLVDTPFGTLRHRSGGSHDDQSLTHDLVATIRPENSRLVDSSKRAESNTFPGVVVEVVFMGNHIEYTVELEGASVRVVDFSTTVASYVEGQDVYVRIPEENVSVFGVTRSRNTTMHDRTTP